ncbi:MAG: NUDIX hydrolase [Clostridium fessum]
MRRRIDCAYRELEEETGYRCDHLEYLMSVNTTIAFCDEALDIFLARDLKKTHQHLDPDEEIEVEAWELSDLLKRIYAGEADGWKDCVRDSGVCLQSRTEVKIRISEAL